MSDVTTPETEEQDWENESAPTATYPEWPKNPANHRFTISFDGRGPMVVVRGNTAAEIIAGFQELEQEAAGAAMGNAWASIKAAAAVASGLGATPVPAGAPVPPQGMPQVPGAPTPPPFGPNVSVPGAPGFQGGAPAMPAPPVAPAPPAQPAVQNQEYRNAGWYRLDVPFPKKAEFDRICAEYQMRKGRPSEGGSYSFNSKGEKAWYVAPSHAGVFPMFSPMPA